EEDHEKIGDFQISMNKPAKFGGYTLYQQGYQLNEFSKMTFKVYEMNDPEAEALGEFTIDLFDLKSEYELENGIIVEVSEYYPDYSLAENGVTSKTNESNNPAFIFNLQLPGNENTET